MHRKLSRVNPINADEQNIDNFNLEILGLPIETFFFLYVNFNKGLVI